MILIRRHNGISHFLHGYNLTSPLSFAEVIGLVLLLMIPPGFTASGLFQEKIYDFSD
jgi:hypothetical protein